MKNSLIGVAILISLFLKIDLYGQPFFDTHVVNKYVKENSFIKSTVDTSVPPSFNESKNKLPSPTWPKRPDVIKMYWRTWELAFNNIRQASGPKGFIAPYIDPAFNNNIFTEDCGFMVLFSRYASKAFNFQQTLDNFYAKQHKDGFICREILGENGNDAFERFDPASAGINIFPWAEWEYFCNVNDLDRLKKVFPVLLANYQWYGVYRSWQDGSYYSSGWGCGMDNQPRLPAGYHHAFSHGHMSWIDATLQQIFAGKILIQMGQILNRRDDVKSIEKEVLHLAEFVNANMWNADEEIYVDRFRDGSLSNVKTIGTFWALLADIVPENRISPFLSHLSDTTEFNRPHRIPTLSADNSKYSTKGGYWLGAVWAMTNYSVLRGLTKVGADSLAFEIADNHLKNVSKIFNETGVIWENYSPEFQHGNDRKNFVGEGGLTGTAILLEYIFGIRADVPGKQIVWDIRILDEFGIDQYPFGKDGMVGLHSKPRKKVTDEPKIRINSNVPFSLKVIWEGGSKVIDVKPDKK
ncbi:MAG TPA: trehalase family glycosidase [Chryseolinea sp.]|nr:trehalase family glycosidase [Chryseolinea sp.]